MLKLKNIAIVCCSTLFLFACDDAKETIENIEKAPELQGRFVSNCRSIGIDGVAGFSKMDELYLAANQTEFTTLYFEGTECSSDKEVGMLEYNGEFNVLNSKDNEGDLRFDLEEAIITIESETLAEALSAVNFCGQSSYEAGENESISSENAGLLCPVQDVPTTLYGSYTYDDQDNTLFLSDEPSDMNLSEAASKLPLIEVFADEFNKK
jgi:hypothetical protein